MPAAVIDRCYWAESSAAQGHPSLSDDLEADVAIIGGGIVGVVAARLLKDRGHSVVVVEAGRLGEGVTGRSTAKVTAQHSVFLQRIERDHGAETARDYAAANQVGVNLIGELVREHGLRCDFEPADSYVYATTDDGADELEREHDAARQAGLPMQLVSTTELPFDVTAALLLPGQAQFQPAAFVAELGRTLPGEGCSVFEHSRAIDWSDTGLKTESGSVTARRVIMATHLPLGQVGQFYAHTSPHMHAVMAVPVDPERAPSGMYISVEKPKRSLRRHRADNGQTVLILTGPTFKHGDAASEAEGFSQLEEFAREHFGWTGGGYRWTNEDYTPRDGLPYVGWSGKDGASMLVATGFDAWGLSNGAAAALTLADLCEGRGDGRADRFDASRHSLSGLGKAAADAMTVTKDLVSGHLDRPPSEARPAEGSIVNIGGRAAGVYREDDGRLRAVSAVCTHMGCRLGWNPVDRTWDCSCHGSRFAAGGQVLHGPAVEPLGAVEWQDERQEAQR